MNKNLAYFAGILRDGSVYLTTNRKRGKKYPKVAVYSKSKDFLLNVIGNIFKDEFSATFNMTNPKNNFRIETSSKKVLDFVMKLNFPSDRKQIHWHTPKLILSSNAEIHKSYIGGFFDAEGTIIISDKTYNCCLRLYQSWYKYNSCPPLEDIKKLLEKFDIKSSLVYANIPHGKKNKFPCYALILRKENILKFCEIINLYHPNKIEKLSILYNFLKNHLQVTKMDWSKLRTDTSDYENNMIGRRSVWVEVPS